MLVITIESPHRTLKISSAGPRLCEWTGDGCRVPSAGPISSWTHNLAHLTSHISPSSHQDTLSSQLGLGSDLWLGGHWPGHGDSDGSGSCSLVTGCWSLGVLNDGSDGSVHQLVQDELLSLSFNNMAFLRSLVILFCA